MVSNEVGMTLRNHVDVSLNINHVVADKCDCDRYPDNLKVNGHVLTVNHRAILESLGMPQITCMPQNDAQQLVGSSSSWAVWWGQLGAPVGSRSSWVVWWA
jgi:hypothetical protein